MESGNLRRGGLLILISKSTVNLVIDLTSKIIKRCISEEVIKAGIFAIELRYNTWHINKRLMCSCCTLC